MISLCEKPRQSNHSLLPIWDVIPITAVNKEAPGQAEEQAYIKSCSLPKALPKSRNMTNIWSIMIWIEIDS